MLFNLLLNIGLLVLIATMLTNLPPVRALLLEEKQTFRSWLWLSLIFGMVSICSTYIGVPIQGAIVNTRVIGVMAAGLLGGPYVGVGAALIGGIHRYLFDIGGFTAVSCALSTIMEGAIGAAFSRKFKAGEIGGGELFLLTAVAEMGQMAIILLVARPYSAAIALVEKISLPMILMNSFGMMVFIGVFNRIFLVEESLYGEKMRIALAIAEKYHLQLSAQAKALLAQETPKVLDRVATQITGSVRELCSAAANACRERGYEPVILTDRLCCEAREAGSFLGSIARTHAGQGKKLAFLAGGETVVHLTGTGLGGRNQELALAAAPMIAGLDAAVFSVGSDGTDGPTDAAGGYVDGSTAAALAQNQLKVYDVLQNNDAYHALKAVDGLIITGATGTNVNDVAVVLIGNQG